MEIKINNLLAVKEATINLDGITVIAGSNTSGKTTICNLINNVFQLYSNKKNIINNNKAMSLKNLGYNNKHYYFEGGDTYKEILEVSDKDLENTIKEYYKIFRMKSDDNELEKEMVTEDLTTEDIEELSQKIRTVMKRSAKIDLEYIFDIFCNKDFKFIDNKDICSIEISSEEQRVVINNNNEMGKFEISTSEFDCNNTIFLPVSRQFDLSSNLIIRFGKKSPYGMYQIDYLSNNFLSKLVSSQSPVSLEEDEKRTKLIQRYREFSNSIIHGQLSYNESKSNFVFQEDGNSYALNNMASGIFPFAILDSLIANGSLKENNFLIIDEPDMNLHPEWQVIFAKILVHLYTEFNIKSLLVSHSPYFIRTIENELIQEKCKGKFYNMEKTADGKFKAKDVSDNIEIIYDNFYKPIESL
jgi:predicted ATPase